MVQKRQAVDIINIVLEDCILAYPVSSFIISLYKQYQERGSLSKKQLQGLHSKASKIKNISPGKLGTLEAIIKKMPTRTKSPLPANTPLYEKDETNGQLINDILAKFPQHKRVLFLQSKYQNNELLSTAEISEIKRLYQVLMNR